MTHPVLDKIRAERDQTRSAALAIAEGDEFDPEDKNFLDLQARADELDKRASTMADLLEKQAAADALDGRMSKAQARQEARAAEPVETRDSMGEQFVRSDVFSGYTMRGTSARLTVETRALPTGIADLTAAGFTGGKTAVDSTAPPFQTPLQDVIAQIPVSTNAIEYVAWEVIAGGADIVAEKALKPSIEFGPVVTPATLDMIAGYTQVTRQMMEDAPAVAARINTGLTREIAKKEESQAALALSGATLPTADVPAGGELLDAIRVGIGTVQAAGYNPNAVLLNPADYAAADINVFYQTNGGTNIQSSYWGLKPVPNPDQPAGLATVGDFTAGAEHYYRSAISLYVTDSHGDTFLHNVFTLLAERRSKTVVVRPDAFAEVSVAAVMASSSSKK